MMTAEMKKRNTNDIAIEEISAGFGLAASGTAPTAKYKAGDKVWYLQGWGMGTVESAELIDHPMAGQFWVYHVYFPEYHDTRWKAMEEDLRPVSKIYLRHHGYIA
ncbi:MAG: hypothetical protein IKN45_09610 [Lachnospiraceae bacterium]|nr:hypothetical protein [Lachnospiraceae bacterium]